MPNLTLWFLQTIISPLLLVGFFIVVFFALAGIDGVPIAKALLVLFINIIVSIFHLAHPSRADDSYFVRTCVATDFGTRLQQDQRQRQITQMEHSRATTCGNALLFHRLGVPLSLHQSHSDRRENHEKRYRNLF